MKNIADLLLRVWQKSRPASNTQVAVMAENRDRSSMADFVRILQALRSRLFENLDAGITRESHHHVVVDILAIWRTN